MGCGCGFPEYQKNTEREIRERANKMDLRVKTIYVKELLIFLKYGRVSHNMF